MVAARRHKTWFLNLTRLLVSSTRRKYRFEDTLTHFLLYCTSCDVQVAVSYQTLDCLQEHGIAANDIQKLNDAGYHTVESVRTLYTYSKSYDDDEIVHLN
jgi:hypothetical protein